MGGAFSDSVLLVPVLGRDLQLRHGVRDACFGVPVLRWPFGLQAWFVLHLLGRKADLQTTLSSLLLRRRLTHHRP